MGKVHSMVESFLKYLQFEKRVSPHTFLAYQNDLQQFQEFLAQTFPEEKIERVSPGAVRSWIISLTEEDLEATSINRKIASLRSFYKFLLTQEAIDKDPLLKIRVLKTKKKLPSFIKEPDMISLLDTAIFEPTFQGCRDKLILELFYSTGIRLSELIQLRESQLDLKNCTIKVLGKRNKERVIPFPSGLVFNIENYREMKAREVGQNEFVFLTEKGEPCYPVMVYRIVKKYLDQHTTADKRSPHVLRHTYATHLLNKGAEINAVKDLLGHSSLAATQVYTHNSIEKLKKTFDKAHPKA